MKYRKKPIVIEAVQYDNVDAESNTPFTFRGEVPAWVQKAIDDYTIIPIQSSEDYWYLGIKTLEGEMRLAPDDWLIQGVKGELYPCRNDIFQATYEPVTLSQ